MKESMLLKLNMEEWLERTESMSDEEQADVEKQLNDLIQEAVLLSRYLAYCQLGRGHIAAGDAAFNDVSKVREILGYTCPDEHFYHVPWF